MTELNDLEWSTPLDDPTRPERPVRTCRRHKWDATIEVPEFDDEGFASGGFTSLWGCSRCGRIKNEALSRRGRTNRQRGNREELTVARKIGGRKMGPLGLPWDVEMPGYARLQVKKLANSPSLRFVAAELARIGSGAEMPGFVWIEPGRGGEALIVFRLSDFAERHGVKVE